MTLLESYSSMSFVQELKFKDFSYNEDISVKSLEILQQNLF